MSHFAMLVVGNNVDKKLKPYQENNTGDCPEEFLEWNSVEEEYKEEYENDTQEMWIKGNKKEFPWSGTFMVGETIIDEEEISDEEKRRLGWEKRDIPFTEIYDSFEEFIDEWAGYSERDEEKGEYGYWHNPNAKWDWYQIGGRYRDRFKLKEDARGEKGKRQEQFVGSLYRESTEGYCDIAKKGDIDWDAIHQTDEDYEKALRFWEMKVEGDEPETEEEKERLKFDMYKPSYYEERYGDKETFAKCRSNFTMWGIVTEDGEWIEKGDMGWFGMSGESHDEAVEWELNFFDEFIKPLDDDTKLTVVDCHI